MLYRKLLWFVAALTIISIGHCEEAEDISDSPVDLCDGQTPVCENVSNPLCQCGPLELRKKEAATAASNTSMRLDCANRKLTTANICPVSEATDGKLLTHVYLQYNLITELKLNENLLSYRGQIEVLHLSNNHIRDVHAHAFEGFGNLTILNLDTNLIQQLRPKSFFDLSKLKVLDLSNNGLTDLRGDMFEPLVNLRVLRLSGNPIELIDNHTFSSLHKLEELFIDGTKLDNVHQEWLVGLGKLKTLSLKNNRFTELPSLQGLTSLRVLHLNDNPVKTIAKNSFLGLRNLEQLFLSNLTQLEMVEECAFCGLLNLKALDLNGCPRLQHIASTAFQKLLFNKKMEIVNFSQCNLTRLDADLLPWENISQIFLHQNPLACSCDLKWISNPQLQIHVPVTCASPQALEGQNVRTLKDSDFTCPLSPAQVKKLRGRIMISVVALLAIVAMLAVVWYLFLGSSCKTANRAKSVLSARKREELYAYRNLAMKSEKDEQQNNNDPEDALWSREWGLMDPVEQGTSHLKPGFKSKPQK